MAAEQRRTQPRRWDLGGAGEQGCCWSLRVVSKEAVLWVNRNGGVVMNGDRYMVNE